MIEDVAMFLFIAATIVSVFAFLSISSYVAIRAEERKSLERLALLRKVADQPSETARLVLDQLREDEMRHEDRRLRKRLQSRRESLLAGLIWLAVGLGIAVMLAAITPKPGIWTIGVIPMLVGLVMVCFAVFSKPDSSTA